MATQIESANALTVIKQQIFAPETTQQFKMALPSHIPVERFQRVTMTAIANNPNLLNAERRSLFNACGKAAQDGLLPDGREAALVTFRSKVKGPDGRDQWIDKVQYMPMIAGILKKVRNSDELAALTAHVVYSRDKFMMKFGDTEELVHEPPPLGEDRGQPVGVYAIATLKNGEKMREVLSKKEVEKIRSVSRSKDNGPWVDWWDEMAKKSAFRRLSKRLPSSSDRDSDLRQLIERDDEIVDLTAVPSDKPQSAADRVTAALAAPVEIDPETGELSGDAPYQAAEQSINDLPGSALPGVPTEPQQQDGAPLAVEAPEQAPPPTKPAWIGANGKTIPFLSFEQMAKIVGGQIAKMDPEQAKGARERNRDILSAMVLAGHSEAAMQIVAALDEREKA